MDGQSFDTLAKWLHAPGTRRGLLGVVAAFGSATSCLLLADGAGAAKRKGKRKGKRRSRRGPAQVQVCHNGKTLRVDRSAVRAVVLAGGSRGACGANDQAACERVLRGAGCRQVFDGVSTIWSCPENTDLEGADLTFCNLIGARLIRVRMNGVHLDRSILNNAHLDGSQLHGGSFEHTDMVQAIAPQANFGGADLRDADFTGASFNSADLVSADLTGAILQNADLRGVSWGNATCPDGHFILHFQDCCGHLNGFTTPFC